MDSSAHRIEKLLALLILQDMKGQPQREKILALNLAGFSNVEIADLLQTSSQVVSQNLYESRRRKTSNRSRGKRKRK